LGLTVKSNFQNGLMFASSALVIRNSLNPVCVENSSWDIATAFTLATTGTITTVSLSSLLLNKDAKRLLFDIQDGDGSQGLVGFAKLCTVNRKCNAQ
jgi:hypothetical protein